MTAHRIVTVAVPPSEPAWWTATCTCGLTATSRTSPVMARQLLDAKHVMAAVKETA